MAGLRDRGFLGSGKTTVLRHILESRHNLKIAVAVNDFAAVNLDSALIESEQRTTVAAGRNGSQRERGGGRPTTEVDVVALSNGCVCCSVRNDFEAAISALIQRADLGEIQ